HIQVRERLVGHLPSGRFGRCRHPGNTVGVSVTRGEKPVTDEARPSEKERNSHRECKQTIATNACGQSGWCVSPLRRRTGASETSVDRDVSVEFETEELLQLGRDPARLLTA